MSFELKDFDAANQDFAMYKDDQYESRLKYIFEGKDCKDNLGLQVTLFNDSWCKHAVIQELNDDSDASFWASLITKPEEFTAILAQCEQYSKTDAKQMREKLSVQYGMGFGTIKTPMFCREAFNEYGIHADEPTFLQNVIFTRFHISESEAIDGMQASMQLMLCENMRTKEMYLVQEHPECGISEKIYNFTMYHFLDDIKENLLLYTVKNGKRNPVLTTRIKNYNNRIEKAKVTKSFYMKGLVWKP